MSFDEITSRLLGTILLIGLGMSLWWLANQWILLRARKNVPSGTGAGVPVVLYFTTPTCAPCKTFQRPVIESLRQNLGEDLKVVEIDASAQPELATQWGVLSVPTIFVLDGQGNPRHVNHGPTGTEKLLQQIKEIR